MLVGRVETCRGSPLAPLALGLCPPLLPPTTSSSISLFLLPVVSSPAQGSSLPHVAFLHLPPGWGSYLYLLLRLKPILRSRKQTEDRGAEPSWAPDLQGMDMQGRVLSSLPCLLLLYFPELPRAPLPVSLPTLTAAVAWFSCPTLSYPYCVLGDVCHPQGQIELPSLKSWVVSGQFSGVKVQLCAC